MTSISTNCILYWLRGDRNSSSSSGLSSRYFMVSRRQHRNLLSAALFTLCIAILTTGSIAAAREWTDNSGQHSIEAELVDHKDGIVQLKRSDGKVISLPFEKLSETDQAFLIAESKDKASPEKNGFEKGDLVFVNSSGRWLLAEVQDVTETSVGTRYHIILDGSQRSMRVSEKRIRSLEEESSQALPGDQVEVRQGTKWVAATLMGVNRNTATVKLNGSHSPTEVSLSRIRTVGGLGDGQSANSSGTSTDARITRLERQMKGLPDVGGSAFGGIIPTKQHPIVLSVATPTQERGVSLLRTPTLEIPSDLPIATDLGEPSKAAFKFNRQTPLQLVSQQSSSRSQSMLSVANSGKAIAVARFGEANEDAFLEILDMTSEKPPLVPAMPDFTCCVAISPEGTRLLTGRSAHNGNSMTFDLWRIVDDKLVSEDSFRFVVEEKDRNLKTAFSRRSVNAHWVSDNLVILDDGQCLYQWNIQTKAPSWRLPIIGPRQYFGFNSQYTLVKSGTQGVIVVDTLAGEVLAAIGGPKCIFGKHSISPSGKTIAIGNHKTFQLWDIESGKKIVWAANPYGNKQFTKWSSKEHLLDFGGHVVDVKKMSVVENSSRLPGVLAAGHRWHLRRETPQAAPIVQFAKVDSYSGDAKLVLETLPALLRPGDAIAIDVQVEPSIQAGVVERLEQLILDRGFRLDNNSGIRLVATTRLGETKSGEYGVTRGLFAGNSFLPPSDVTTVSWQVHHYSITLEVEGREIISETSSPGSGGVGSPRIEDGESIQQAIHRSLQWSPSGMPRIQLPDYIFPMSVITNPD